NDRRIEENKHQLELRPLRQQFRERKRYPVVLDGLVLLQRKKELDQFHTLAVLLLDRIIDPRQRPRLGISQRLLYLILKMLHKPIGRRRPPIAIPKDRVGRKPERGQHDRILAL